MILILLIAAIFGFILSTILFLKDSTNTKATLLLGSFYFLLSFYTLHTYIVDAGYLHHFSWCFLWPLLPFNLLFIPIYYYFQVILTDTLKWKKRDVILFVPFIIAILDVGYVYAQSDNVLKTLLQEATNFPEERLQAEYWLLSLNQHVLIRHMWQFGVLMVILPEIVRFKRRRQDDNLKLILNKWLIIFWSVLMFMAILAVLYALEKMFVGVGVDSEFITGENGGIVTLTLYTALFLIGVIPLYFPSILHGYPQSARKIPSEKLEEKNNELKFGLEEEEMEAKLNELEESKLYLNQSFDLTECARHLELPSHHISYYLKRRYELNFATYKNNLRMEYAKSLIGNGFLENNTIEALANECGFASRTSFSKTFKNVVSVSPSQYTLSVK